MMADVKWLRHNDFAGVNAGASHWASIVNRNHRNFGLVVVRILGRPLEKRTLSSDLLW